ncbi:FG-GAP-like repeat-containing protein [Streptomyces sp. NPDC058682]|uniref:FG-GAP-like repeat-containing protein n=1 Tax=Streptomyces sp. NPDC058682 TaxID=3346596 RepID=UPI003669ABD8
MNRVRPRERTGRRGLAFLATALLACASTVLPVGAAASTAVPAAAAAPPKASTLFDDFNYTSPSDPALAAHGWTVRSDSGGPGPGTNWSPSKVSFPDDASAQGKRSMLLQATTDGTAAGTAQAQIQTTRHKFYSGTYAARVHFSDKPTTGPAGDHPAQTFYAIGMKKPDSLYSEIDFEYVPNGGWGDLGPSLYTTAWNYPAEQPTDADRVFRKDEAPRSLQGWHTLQMTVDNGMVAYYVDGRPFFSTTTYSPRQPMTINFNHWFTDLTLPGQSRTWDQKVNWVYYSESGAMKPAEVDAAVNGYYASGTHFVDTVAEKKNPEHDYNGDGVSDVSLFYDYGRSTASGCAQNGAKRTALFALPGSPDRSGNFGGDRMESLWDGPCEPVNPKFVTSGDYNGDGRSDIAALYDYGTTGSTCVHNHVAIVAWLAETDGTLKPAPKPAWESFCWGAGTKFLTSGDYNGDGTSDLGLLYHDGDERLRLFTISADKNGSGFGDLVSRWEGTNWGSRTKFVASGDYNGDGKGDLALFFDYGTDGSTCAGGAHQAIFTLTADADARGGFNGGGNPTKIWKNSCWGEGTKFLTSGDFNGDGKSDLTLFYDYTAGHVSLYTLSAHANGDGGFSLPVAKWDRTDWGPGTRFLTTGDYNGDGKSDIALFYDYGTIGATCGGDAHQAVFALSASPYGTGALQDFRRPWDHTCWGGGTVSMN